jgi:hypothetical protein
MAMMSMVTVMMNLDRRNSNRVRSNFSVQFVKLSFDFANLLGTRFVRLGFSEETTEFCTFLLVMNSFLDDSQVLTKLLGLLVVTMLHSTTNSSSQSVALVRQDLDSVLRRSQRFKLCFDVMKTDFKRRDFGSVAFTLSLS